MSRHTPGQFLIENGLSAAGSALQWLERLSGWTTLDLVHAAAAVPAGADGLLAFPWLHGARAPWWRPDVQAAFVGASAVHGPPEFSRAVIEGIAFDVDRCIEQSSPHADELAVAGQGATDPLWRFILAAVTGLPIVRHAIDDAASVGARLLVAEAFGQKLGPDELNPPTEQTIADTSTRTVYQRLRERSDRAADALIADGTAKHTES